MGTTQVRVRRERPTAAAWALALLLTMLVVFALTLGATAPDAVESVSAAPRVTRQVVFAAMERWCVSMGRYEDAGRARIEAAGCASGGGAGMVQQIDGGWHVLGAMYASERAAKRVAGRLEAKGFPAEVLRLRADRVELRITAPERQIEAIAAADAALRDRVKQLDDMALQLDHGELQTDGARTLCALACTETDQTRQALAMQSGASESGLSAALVEALEALSAQLRDISDSGQTSRVALSGMLRLAEIDAFLRLRALQQALGAGV